LGGCADINIDASNLKIPGLSTAEPNGRRERVEARCGSPLGAGAARAERPLARL
jgi:hypothetical protein